MNAILRVLQHTTSGLSPRSWFTSPRAQAVTDQAILAPPTAAPRTRSEDADGTPAAGSADALVAGIPLPEGLHDHPELRAWLARDHAAAGRSKGLREPSHEGLSRAAEEHLAVYDNLLAAMISRCDARRERVQRFRLDIGSLSPLDLDRADSALRALERTVGELEEQRSFAREGRGLYRAPIAQFRQGFLQGMREAHAVQHLLG